MSTLTPNRILQKGDQFNAAGKGWQPVPKEEWGLQVMFSKLKQFELRRPTETPKNGEKISAVPVLAEPSCESPDARALGEARESNTKDQSRLATQESRGGGKPLLGKLDANGLPTVISPKAHKVPETVGKDGNRLPFLPLGKPKRIIKVGHGYLGPITKAVAKAKAKSGGIGIDIDYPKTTGISDVSWTGRNGTFKGYGLSVFHTMADTVMLEPIGKRGKGNCLIEIPVSAIPQLVDWLRVNVIPTIK